MNLRKDASCQAKTFHMEDELFGCPDEALWVTSESITKAGDEKNRISSILYVVFHTSPATKPLHR